MQFVTKLLKLKREVGKQFPWRTHQVNFILFFSYYLTLKILYNLYIIDNLNI